MRCALVLILFVCALLMLASPPAAKAQVTPTSTLIVTNSGTNIATAIPSATALSRIPIIQGKNLTLTKSFTLSGSGTENIIYWLYPCPDGTNRATVNPWIWITAANGTSAVIDPTNIAKQYLEGYKFLDVYQISNASARTAFITNLIATWGNN